MKAFVTGGSGFTGGALCAHLRSPRPRRGGAGASRLRARRICNRSARTLATGDLGDAESHARVGMDGADVAFNIAAAFREVRLSDEQYHEVNVTGARNFVEAARAAGVPRVVHCSTIGVHGDTGRVPATEETRFAPPDYYCKSKVEGELLVRELVAKYNMQGSVFRPAGHLRAARHPLSEAVPGAQACGRFVMIGDGTTLYHMTYIDDLWGDRAVRHAA